MSRKCIHFAMLPCCHVAPALTIQRHHFPKVSMGVRAYSTCTESAPTIDSNSYTQPDEFRVSRLGRTSMGCPSSRHFHSGLASLQSHHRHRPTNCSQSYQGHGPYTGATSSTCFRQVTHRKHNTAPRNTRMPTPRLGITRNHNKNRHRNRNQHQQKDLKKQGPRVT